MWPLLLAEVSIGARHPSVAIGGITAAGYLGIVAGPAIVGALSGLFDLRVGLLVLGGGRCSSRSYRRGWGERPATMPIRPAARTRRS